MPSFSTCAFVDRNASIRGAQRSWMRLCTASLSSKSFPARSTRFEVENGRIYCDNFIVFPYFDDVHPGDGGLLVRLFNIKFCRCQILFGFLPILRGWTAKWKPIGAARLAQEQLRAATRPVPTPFQCICHPTPATCSCVLVYVI